MMKTIKYLGILIAALCLASCTKVGSSSAEDLVEEALKSVKMVSVEEAKTIIEGEELYNLIDVREKEEYYLGYIPGSVVIPRGRLEFSIASPEFWEAEGLYLPEKKETFVVYCKKGKRSILAAQSLMQMGYKNVVVIDGGWKGWELKFPDFTEKNLEMLQGGGGSHGDTGGC